jgi:hypothetical protein
MEAEAAGDRLAAHDLPSQNFSRRVATKLMASVTQDRCGCASILPQEAMRLIRKPVSWQSSVNH